MIQTQLAIGKSENIFVGRCMSCRSTALTVPRVPVFVTQIGPYEIRLCKEHLTELNQNINTTLKREKT